MTLNLLSEISPAVVESPLFYGKTIPGAFYGAAGTVLAQTLSETFDITGEYVLHINICAYLDIHVQ